MDRLFKLSYFSKVKMERPVPQLQADNLEDRQGHLADSLTCSEKHNFLTIINQAAIALLRNYRKSDHTAS
jgi:hypothetical protein